MRRSKGGLRAHEFVDSVVFFLNLQSWVVSEHDSDWS